MATVEIDRYRPISNGNGTKTAQSTVPVGSRQSAYRFAGEPIHIARYRWYHSKLKFLVYTMVTRKFQFLQKGLKVLFFTKKTSTKKEVKVVLPTVTQREQTKKKKMEGI